MLGIDLGSVRIGLALSDPTRTVASPYSVLRRGRDRQADHRAIVKIAGEEEVTTIVVGLPLSLSGAKGPAARAAESEIEELQVAVGDGIDVVAHDERLTTITAERSLDEARHEARRPEARRRQDRGRGDVAVVVGVAAAAVGPMRPRR